MVFRPGCRSGARLPTSILRKIAEGWGMVRQLGRSFVARKSYFAASLPLLLGSHPVVFKILLSRTVDPDLQRPNEAQWPRMADQVISSGALPAFLGKKRVS